LDEQRGVGGWLFVVSYNKAISFLRRSVREKILPLEEHTLEGAQSPDTTQDEQEFQFNLLHAAIESLPPAKKQVFILCKLEGKSYEEAARTIGISQHTVKEYVASSLKFIRSHTIRQQGLNSPFTLCALVCLLNHF
jgi:RNA polymerase sigma-70 factor (ECF subfamily)